MMDTTLDGLDSTNAFLDDIIIITKGTIEKHENEIDKSLKKTRPRKSSNKPSQMRIWPNRNYLARIQNKFGRYYPN